MLLDGIVVMILIKLKGHTVVPWIWLEKIVASYIMVMTVKGDEPMLISENVHLIHCHGILERLYFFSSCIKMSWDTVSRPDGGGRPSACTHPTACNALRTV